MAFRLDGYGYEATNTTGGPAEITENVCAMLCMRDGRYCVTNSSGKCDGIEARSNCSMSEALRLQSKQHLV
jgi:hypothetical protein